MIHAHFESQVLKSLEAIAVSFEGKVLSYTTLNARANQLAGYLRKTSVGPEIRVALFLDRSLEMVVAILGVLKAGGAYVPIDLAYPPERVAFMLEDAQAPVLLTQHGLLNRLPHTLAKVICLDSDWESIAEHSPENLPDLAAPDRAAYVIYTSGSTGKPKGVVVTHHNVVRLLTQTASWYRFDATDVWPLFHSYAFDVSVWELWGALFHGGRLVVPPYLLTRSPFEFYEMLAREKVTVLNQTPSAFRQLIWAEETADRKLDLSLRYVICAGEALELQSLKPWFDRHGDHQPRVVNMYGITETTVHAMYRPINRADLASGVGSVIGAPIPDLQIHLLDADQKPVPPGTPGEIYVGGDGIARGYLNRPELTAQRFLPDPFSPRPGARLYRSGDLAHVNDQGELEYAGRIDHQVKIRGFRVELGEIESALNTHPRVRESIVVAREEASGGKRLLAYFVPVAPAPSVTELREFLGRRLPDYMVPARFAALDALPLTTNGKVDRRALPDPDGARPEVTSEFVPPATAAEEQLAAIWREVLQIQQVGTGDNFFELGGDSIRSIQVLSRAAEAGLHFSLADMFERPTIAGLLECAGLRIQSAPPDGRSEPFALIRAADRAALPPDVDDAYPVARLQLGMFFHNELKPLSAMYHDVFTYRVEAPLAEAKFREAARLLAQRHPIFRTSFHIAGFSEPVQLIHRDVEIPLTIEDLSQCPGDDQEQRIVAWIETEKRRPFDRTIAPLIRFHVQTLNPSRFHLFVSFHHSCVDGWSLAVLVTELLRDYHSLLHGQPPSTATPKAAYRDFVALETRTIQDPPTREFWIENLKEAVPSRLPRWPARMCRGGAEQVRAREIQIAPRIFEGLKRLAQLAGTPLKTVLLAAHQRVMSLLHGDPEVVTGLVMNGRPEIVDGARMLGLFLNTVPLRQRLDGGTWTDLVRHTFAAEQRLLRHRRMPVSEIQKLAGGRMLFETAFDFVHFHVLNDLARLNDLKVIESHYFEANNLATYTTFILDPNSAALAMHIDYDPTIIAPEQAEEINGYYLRTLEAMAADPQNDYDSLSPMSDEQVRRITLEWNATEQACPRTRCIHDLFEAQVALRPDAEAVCCGTESLSYGELHRRAEDLAEALRQAGVTPGTLIGICVDRSASMVAALLGILKAGGAYVPLDPAYPQERLRSMLDQAAAGFLITEKSCLPQFAGYRGTILTLEPGLWEKQSPGADIKASAQNSGDLAYVIFTSGSTGRPKGVQVEHRSVVNLLQSAARTGGIDQTDRLLAVTTLSFDIAGLELFMPLVTGGTVIIAERPVLSDGVRLGALVEQSKASVMQGTPATWRLLVEAGWEGKPGLKIFCGGERLKPDLGDQLLRRGAGVWNLYGPTETTIWSTVWKVEAGEPVRIGRPLANTQVYVLDRKLRPVPIGTTGELFISGDGLARGYLNQPEQTAERFIPNPWRPGTRMYRTGDLARWWPDGTLECLGRIDHQVKIRGFRIEPAEVEAVLRQHKGIADALVTSRPDALGEQRLIGYLLSNNGPPSIPDLREFAKTKLPAYMIPAQFVLLKSFPLTPNGKVDLQQLPSPEGSAQPLREYVPPTDEDEQSLVAIWAEVLSLKQVSIADNFFELGGDSLSATRAFARVNAAYGIRLSLQDLFEHSTIRELAPLVRGARAGSRRQNSVIPRLPRLRTSLQVSS
jgi:amino acid adenylation domain-containing protein